MHKLNKKQINQKITGFTMVELIVTLLIGSLLLAWGFPNYRDFKVRKEVSLSANEMVYSFSLARAEAIRYGSDVRVSLTGGDWSEGWQIWTLDEFGNGVTQIFDQQALPDLAINQTSGTAGEIVFNRLGALVGGNTVNFETDNSYSPVLDSQRNIIISPSGSARVVEP